MKKEGKIVLTFVLASFLVAVSLVSAETNFDVVSKQIAQGTTDIFGNIGLDQVNITIILFGILLWMVLYSVLTKIGVFKGRNPWWVGMMALVITVLALYYKEGMPEFFVDAIQAPYQAMGATILTVLPIVILIYFTIFVSESLIFSRIIWIAFTFYYIYAILYAWAMQPAGNNIASITPYLIAAVAGFALGIVGLIKPIRSWVINEEVHSKEERVLRNVKKGRAGLKGLTTVADTYGDLE